MPFMQPFNSLFDYSNNTVSFAVNSFSVDNMKLNPMIEADPHNNETLGDFSIFNAGDMIYLGYMYFGNPSQSNDTIA